MLNHDILNGARYMQYVATVSATLSLACYGMYSSWSSPNLPRLTSIDSPIGTTLTPSEASWVASSFQLGLIPGGIISGWLVSKFGPKYSLLVSVIPLCCPWIIIILAKSALALCIARFIAGVGGSIAVTAVPIYSAEVSDKDIRGKLGSACNMLTIIGTLFVLTVGPFVSYTSLAIVCGICPLIFGIVLFAMPESPFHLVKTNQMTAAHHSIMKLCASNADEEIFQNRLKDISDTVSIDMQNKSTFWELITKSAYRRPLMVMIGLKLIQQFSGMAAIDAYMQTIIESSNSNISPQHSSIIFGFVQLLAAFIASAIVDRAGRKPILVISALSSAFSLFVEGIYFYLYANGSHTFVTTHLSWLPTTGLVIYLILNPLGLGTLPYVLMGEIFPTNVKSQAVALNTVLRGILGFIAVASFEPLSKYCGMYSTFFTFATVALLGAGFIFTVLPETKQKTFIEIQSKFNKNYAI